MAIRAPDGANKAEQNQTHKERRRYRNIKKTTEHNNKPPELFLHPPAVTPFCQAPLYILMLHLEGVAILRKDRKNGKVNLRNKKESRNKRAP